MGEELGADVDHKIPVAMPGQRGTLETTTYFRAGETIGTDVGDFNDPESRHTIGLVKNNLLPHCSTVLRYLTLSKTQTSSSPKLPHEMSFIQFQRIFDNSWVLLLINFCFRSPKRMTVKSACTIQWNAMPWEPILTTNCDSMDKRIYQVYALSNIKQLSLHDKSQCCLSNY